MRKITTHQVDGAPAPLLHAAEKLGPGGAPHVYNIHGMSNLVDHPELDDALNYADLDSQQILFQHGGVPENGINGVTIELLLAICADRLRCFQAGPFPSPFNERALAAILIALETLHLRTAERQARGVEGRAVP